jgi:membrane-associated HD superfamily phosphohydrolase
MVNKIVDGQVAEGLLRETPISFRDVETVKKLFIERLRTAYHARVAYPSEIRKTIEEETPPTTGTSADSNSKPSEAQ